MRIDKKLNLVIPVETDAGIIYVHSAPIGRDIFDQYWLVLSRTFAFIYNKGLHNIAPRIAHMALEKVAEEEGALQEVKSGLVNEIIRLSNVITPSENGYITGTLSDAITRKIISTEDFSNIKGMLVFSTLVSSVGKKNLIKPMMDYISELWSTSTTYLNSTEFKDSLQTLIAEQTLKPLETETVSSIPH